MLSESLLAYLHFIAIGALVVFVAGEAALCRPEWLNAEALKRLGRVDQLYALSALAVLASGLARTWWGIKGFGWYWSQPLLWTKLALFVLIGLLSIKQTLAFIRWRRAHDAGRGLPPPDEVRAVRRWIMIQAHLLLLVPLAAVLLARGVFVRG